MEYEYLLSRNKLFPLVVLILKSLFSEYTSYLNIIAHDSLKKINQGEGVE